MMMNGASNIEVSIEITSEIDTKMNHGWTLYQCLYDMLTNVDPTLVKQCQIKVDITVSTLNDVFHICYKISTKYECCNIFL